MHRKKQDARLTLVAKMRWVFFNKTAFPPSPKRLVALGGGKMKSIHVIRQQDLQSIGQSKIKYREVPVSEKESVILENEDTDPFDDEDAYQQPDSEDIQDSQELALASPTLPAFVPGKDSLHIYLNEVGRFPILQPDEEFELARQVRDTNDNHAAFRLISSHLRLVVKIAMDFQRRWMQNVLDLIQEGNVGLMHAVHKFDPDKGIKFSYYAGFWIRAYILKFIMDNWRMVKIGTTQAQRKLFYNLNKERQKLLAEGYDPDARTLAERLHVEEEEIVEMQQRLDASDMSLDIHVGDDSGSATRLDFVPALGPGVEENVATGEMATILRDHLEEIKTSLSEKERYILENRLLSDEPITLRAIGERYHVTRERVRQLEARLLQKLRDYLRSKVKDFSAEWIN